MILIIHICETWSRTYGQFNDFLKSYFHFENVRKIKDNAKRNSGGISVFFKSGLCKRLSFQRLYKYFDNTVVYFVNYLPTICQSEDVIMYFTYISPKGPCYYNDKYDRNGIDVMYQHLEVITVDDPKNLVNLYGVFDIPFLNGRFSGDRCGEFTCFSNDGTSVVDYMIASSMLFKYITDFKVLNIDESDHFPICVVFLISLENDQFD